MKNCLTSLLLLCSTVFLFAQDYNAEELQQLRVDVVYLASDLLGGRETGTEGEQLAAEYIATRFRQLGLEPAGTQGYFQPFDFKFSTDPHGANAQARSGKNIVGWIDNGKKQTIVIGGHYDHLGHGHFGSRHVGEAAIHNGADDNASGIAAIFRLAKHLKAQKKPRHNYLFVAFSGEEMGLFGSKYFVDHAPVAVGQMNYMLNLDMVGRLNEAKVLAINGAGTSPVWKPTFEKLDVNGITVKTTDSGVGPSDHTSFYLKNVPALHFFSGQHMDYHKPEDDAELVNYEGIYDITEFMLALVKNLERTDKIEFTKTVDQTDNRQAASFKVTLGIMPDYVHDGTGMRIDAVLPGRVAEKGGLENGDVVVKIGEHDVEDIYGYMEALGKFEPGDSADVVVVRKGERVTKRVTF